MSAEVKDQAKYPDGNTNPLPEGKSLKLAVGLKCLLGIVGIGEMVYYGFSFWGNKNEEETGSGGGREGAGQGDAPEVIGEAAGDAPGKAGCLNPLELFKFCIDLADFGISYAVGYHVYAPLDASRIKAGDYADLIKDISGDSKISSDVWIGRTVLSFGTDIISIFRFKCGAFKCIQGFWVKKVLVGVNALLAAVSCIYEITAVCIAAALEDSKLTGKQKIDKKAFLTENSGFIAKDVVEIADYFIGVLKVKNKGIIFGRELVKFAYPLTMFVEAGLINNQPS